MYISQNFSYRVSDNRDVSQIISKKTLEDGREIVQIEGSYSHIGPDGKEYKMHYFADENGYHPNARSKKNAKVKMQLCGR